MKKEKRLRKCFNFKTFFLIKQSSKGSKSVKIPHIDCNAAHVCPSTKMASKWGGVARNKAQKTFHRWANAIELAVNAMIFQLTLNLGSHSLIYLWFGVSLKTNTTTNFEKENEYNFFLSVIGAVKKFVLVFANFKVKLNLYLFCL